MAHGKGWSHARVRKNAEVRGRTKGTAPERTGNGPAKPPRPQGGTSPAGSFAYAHARIGRAPSSGAAARPGAKGSKEARLARIQERARQEREEAATRIGPRGGRTPKIASCHVVAKRTRKSMQGNKGKDTKPELLVRQRLREAGLGGYRLQWKAPGRPDVAWPGKKVCILVNGCFWHRCPHCSPPLPKSNVEYWTVKFERNRERDERNLRQLREAGWTVHVVWECQLKKDTVEQTMAELLPQLARELGKELRA